jgi:hypothetical protein
MRAHRWVAWALLVVATMLTGCSDDDPRAQSSAPASSESPSASASVSPPVSTTASPTSRPSSQGATSYVESLIFMMPSGNLGCLIARRTLTTGTVACQGSWSFSPPPPPPGGCGGTGDWGAIIELEVQPEFACASDTFLGDYPTLAYGRSVQVANIACTSAQTGVTCRNTANGRGFKVSRSRYSFNRPPAPASPVFDDPMGYVQTVAFATPSRNIGCVLTHFADDGHALVSCAITQYSYQPPPRPADCPSGPWGNNLIMGNVSYVQCAGGEDVHTATYPVLPYGGRVTLDSVTCTSQTTGIVCSDPTNGRRITLSKERYSLS